MAEGKDGSEELVPDFALELFFLTHPDVDDIEKLRVCDVVLPSVKAYLLISLLP